MAVQPPAPGRHTLLRLPGPFAHGRALACPAAAATRTAYSEGIGKEEIDHVRRRKQDGRGTALIHLEPEWERRNWCKWLGCDEAQLEHAVTYVGHDPDNVRRFLRQAR
ncbi:DUF3606 domain-containing protein [Ramlibacter montanisoli]|uniref:DUF3606 domain-containing protein n=1 Tax=Ramlibacter montanisoli TaxID=2732512 RepID=A0A849K914_9BURK|nr:DUF3606 domain-containing protein [Ramlibacter montanisoli]NNU42924.1 DUF3606 domain-containing protein [Ramlibacter montanisoli]